jgi:predicted transglutaminase-like cysteine proteinase
VNKAITALAALAALLAMTPSAAGAATPLFGTSEFRAESLAALPKWQRALRQIEQERSTYRACARSSVDCPSPSVVAWRSVIRSQIGRPPIEQLRAVNRFLNEWRYKPDDQNYGRRDYWATPLEFLRRSGDCEDYAIAKYVTLRELGFTPEQLRLAVVRDVARNLAHAVLAVYLDDQVYVLDNLTTAVLPQERISHYVPYYSINEETRWAHVPPSDPVVAAGSPRVTPSAEAD